MTNSAASKDLDAIVRRLRRVRLKLGPAATRVLDVLADDPSWILDRTSLDIAARARTSDATVIRTIQALGYAGLSDLRGQVELATRTQLSVADKLGRTLGDMRPGFAGAIDQAAEANRVGLAAIRAEMASGSFGAAVDLIYDAKRIVVCADRAWSGLRAHVRWSFDGLGFDTLERDLVAPSGPGDPAPPGEPGDLLLALVLPPSAPAGSGILAADWRGDRPLLIVSDVAVEGPTPDLVGLRIPCGLPGQLSLASPVATLIDALMLGLLTCCPDETMRRAARRRTQETQFTEEEPGCVAG